jgi:uncharacterized OsmC-like protein
MSTDAGIKEAVERIVEGLQRDPGSGQGTMHLEARLERGLTCVMTEGSWTLTSDAPPIVGGDGRGPSPGVYGRAAVASCIAMGIKIIAARIDHPIDAVTVQMDGDYDWRGDFELDDISPGFQRFRLTITVASPADRKATVKIVEDALRLSSWFNTLVRQQIVDVELEIAGDQRRHLELRMG